MKPYDRLYSGGYTCTYPDGYVEWNTVNKSQHQLVCAPMKKGDFHHPNSHWYSVSDHNGLKIQATYPYNGPRGVGSMVFSGDWAPLGSTGLITWDNDDQNLANARALDELNESIRGSTDLSIDAFQLDKTLALRKDIGKVVSSLLKIKRNPANWRLFTNTTSSVWLQWVYGIKPTLQSIHDIVHHTSNFYQEEGIMFKGRGTVKRSVAVPDDNVPDISFQGTTQCSTSRRCEIKCFLCIPNNSLTNIARLTSLNPASIAWELMPFSFVVDWFVNIGGYVRNLETALIYQRYFKYGYQTISYSHSATYNYTRRHSWLPATGVISGTGSWRGMSRSELSGFPRPQLPSLNTTLGSGRLLNAAALLGSFLKGR